MNSRESDTYFPRPQKHLNNKKVSFMLEGSESNNRNHSLSNSHGTIAFEITFDNFGGDNHLSIEH